MTKTPLTLTHFTLDVDNDGVAFITFDLQGEKVNVLSPKAAEDIQKIVARLEDDAQIRAIVFASKKPDNFIAGADISVIRTLTNAAEATRLAKDLQDLFLRMERLYEVKGKPVVAAIHGSCLGGGMELALACTSRVCSDHKKTVMGLPEVKLGLIPGAGGTQRLPRLVGIANGLDMILTGKNIYPSKAKKLGLVDEVVPEAILLEVAKKRALRLAKAGKDGPDIDAKKRPPAWKKFTDTAYLTELALEENPVGQRLLFKKAREALLDKTRGNYPAPERAIEVIRIGVLEGLEAGYAAEADRFGHLVMSPESKALISIFFATQELKKDNGVADPEIKGKAIRKVGVLGGGLMGGGIAAVTAQSAKTPVRLHEVDAAGVGRGLKYVNKLLRSDVKKRRLREGEAARILSQVTGTSDYSGFKSCDVVIEAVFEDLELKRKVLREVEGRGKADVIFASNTSSLPITGIAEASQHPETVIGMHYFSPVEKMPLLEIIVTDKTAPWVTATCVELGKKQGKTVIVVRDGTGFYTSRILAPYMNEAAFAVAEGASIEDLDAAMVDAGFPVGPITLLDEVGIDVGDKVGKIMRQAFGSRLDPPGTMEKLIADGRKGRKSGRGFYLYEDGKKGGVDPSVYALLGERPKHGPSQKDMQERLILQMVNEAARCLEEGILRSARDGDIGAIFGLGFPPFLGGPFAYVDRRGAADVVKSLDALATKHGARFGAAQILRDYAKSGKKLRA